ncbi:integral membrane protein [Neisseria canis]|uniref:Integral membrane protein n=1 Tax=Neisseria canis TaxID=493 RepID=A0A448D5P4_9NEIS|nr:integral membrane protein [Neisseria canis]
MSHSPEKPYAELHKPSSDFPTRNEYLEHELQIMQPKRWRANLPFRDYRFEFEDMIPAMAGTIGKVVMVGAVAAAFAGPLGLPEGFVLENVRYELLIASVFILLLSGFFLPSANLPGTHGPLIPLIPLVVAAGGHPLAFGLLIGLFGFLLGISKGGSLMAKLTSNGVCGGLLLYLGFIGTTGQVKKLFTWAEGFNMPHIAFIVILGTILLYALLEHWQKRWLAVPLGCLLAGVTAYVLGAPFEFKTAPGLPPMSPAYWWDENSGWMLGLPTMESFLVVFPFAVLAVAMWSPDFLGHQVFQKISYPERTEKVHMNIDDTMISCSARQTVGSILGGANFSSSWGTYIVPASIAKRPIPAGAVLTALFCIVAGIWGYPMDLAIWQPVLSVALVVGVYVPLLEAGMEMTRKGKTTQSAAVVVFASALVNPVFGWSLTMLLDNLGLIGCKERSTELGFSGRVVVPLAGFVILCVAMGAVGMFPGIPAFLEDFRSK